MMLKVVYGLPPPDVERIEAVEPKEENCIREEKDSANPVKAEQQEA